MSNLLRPRIALALLALAGVRLAGWSFVGLAAPAQPPEKPGPDAKKSADDALDGQFASKVRPFLQRYCLSCHGPDRQEVALDLSRDVTPKAVAANLALWEQVHDRLHAD